MHWKDKPRTILDKIKVKFALFPTKVNDEWVWLERYYALRAWNMLGCYEVEYRWRTKEEAVKALEEVLHE